MHRNTCLIGLLGLVSPGFGQELGPIPFGRVYPLFVDSDADFDSTPALSGDFNGDGRLDFMFESPSTSEAWLALSAEHGGATTFVFPNTSFCPNLTKSVPTDFLHDGLSDVVEVTRAGRAVNLYDGDGEGRFTAREVILLGEPATSGPSYGDPLVCDYDGDGWDDLLVVGWTRCAPDDGAGDDEYVSLVWMKGGPQGYEPPRSVGADLPPGHPTSGRATPVWKGLADADGDGHADLLTLDASYVMINRGGPDGFGPVQVFSELFQHTDGVSDLKHRVLDVNGDGLPDVVEFGEERPTVHALRSDGRWVTDRRRVPYPTSWLSSSKPYGVWPGAGSRGRDAIYVRNGFLVVFDETGLPQYERIELPSLSPSSGVILLGCDDVDGDGASDLFGVFAHRTTGNFAMQFPVRVVAFPLQDRPGVPRFGLAPAGLGELPTASREVPSSHVLCVDLDGDGRDEVVSSSDNEVGTWIGYPATGVTDVAVSGVHAAAGFRSMSGDLDGDGSPDIIWFGDDRNEYAYFALNDGSGGMRVQGWQYPGREGTQSGLILQVDDFDTDGTDEIVVVNHEIDGGVFGGFSIATYRYIGADAGGEVQCSQLFRTDIPAIQSIAMIAWGSVLMDVDADGQKDIVFAAQLHDGWTGIVAIRGTGQGGFLPVPLRMAEFGSSWKAYWLAADDIDGDGLVDLILRHLPYQVQSYDSGVEQVSTSVLWGTNDHPSDPTAVRPTLTLNNSDEIITFDIDGNGLKDIVYCNGDVIGVVRQSSPRVFETIPRGYDFVYGPYFLNRSSECLLSGVQVSGLAVTDYNGDGLQDIVYSSSALGTASQRNMYVVYNIGAAPDPAACPADLAAPFGTLNVFDIIEFIARYNTQDPAADLADPAGSFNIFDVQAYLGLYNAGCP